MEDKCKYLPIKTGGKPVRYFHIAFLTRGALGFKTFASEKFPSMDEIAADAGVSPDDCIITGIYEFRSVDDFEAFTGQVVPDEPEVLLHHLV